MKRPGLPIGRPGRFALMGKELGTVPFRFAGLAVLDTGPGRLPDFRTDWAA